MHTIYCCIARFSYIAPVFTYYILLPVSTVDYFYSSWHCQSKTRQRSFKNTTTF